MPAKHAQDLQETYAEVVKGYVGSHGNDLDEGFLNTFLSLIPANTSVLDLGAGVGRDTEYFVKKGWQVTAFDFSPEMLALAKERASKAEFIIGDMLDFNFPGESYGGVWASMSLLHLTKKEMKVMLKKIKDMLVPGGVFGLKMREGIGEQVVESAKYGKPMKRFFAYYQEDELVEIINQAGFTVLNHFALQQSDPQRTLFVLARK